MPVVGSANPLLSELIDLTEAFAPATDNPTVNPPSPTCCHAAFASASVLAPIAFATPLAIFAPPETIPMPASTKPAGGNTTHNAAVATAPSNLAGFVTISLTVFTTILAAPLNIFPIALKNPILPSFLPSVHPLDSRYSSLVIEFVEFVDDVVPLNNDICPCTELMVSASCLSSCGFPYGFT